MASVTKINPFDSYIIDDSGKEYIHWGDAAASKGCSLLIMGTHAQEHLSRGLGASKWVWERYMSWGRALPLSVFLYSYLKYSFWCFWKSQGPGSEVSGCDRHHGFQEYSHSISHESGPVWGPGGVENMYSVGDWFLGWISIWGSHWPFPQTLL